ncbi:iron chelate uptake ABC transporter family permease subunit [Shewanella sp. SM101]|uniref:iron chelate uptake ABC transporter family permease subunit n=1 Tax=unclassified Shewanella TaxID=196818 RepID=UPI0021D95F9E|nr:MULTISPECIES: iron chelate uptake ABC transporter family permease subunit [unclassified Shewanella]MCU8056716.1 iron chelate uptake ABC transporter family permease subunit [Shewanella sp. SM35]MCU8065649.1 iron chelate uptake ABC transporter family permease subunit [Shewanella sp. SM34]MCU8104787.1 iron chelate uptake ABC transporter family permease subunit [Shewanella sp. SM101]
MKDSAWRFLSWGLPIMLAVTFLLMGSGFDFDYVIPNRLVRLATICLGGVCIAFSSILFQTLAGNRILTPSIMGYEGIYLIFQVLLILILGTGSSILITANSNFFVSVVVMLLYSMAIHRWLFSGDRHDVFFLLLVGLVLTVVLGSFTQLIQYSISPGEFSIFQSYSLASFNRAQPEQLLISLVLVSAVCIAAWRVRAVLDVLLMGREQAISLGIDYQKVVRLLLGLIAVLVAISTSLVGPTAFMGIFVANMAYALARHPSHSFTLITGCAVAISVFLIAQMLVEHLFNYQTSVGLLINLFCGAYFFVLILKPRSAV